jgi:hypothetical protein
MGGVMLSAGLMCPEEYKQLPLRYILQSDYIKQAYFSTFISQSMLNLPTEYTKFIPHEHTQRAIYSHLDKKIGDNVSGGVRILWGPPGCGKSTYTITECNRLKEDGTLAGVVLLRECMNNECETSTWLNKCIGHDVLSLGSPLSTLFSHQPKKHTVFLFDQFDNIYRKCQDKQALKVAIKHLAEDGEKHDSFIVVLCISDPEIAAEMLRLNGGKKIRLIDHSPNEMKWSEEEVLDYVSEKHFTKDQTSACVKVGTPQFCKDVYEYKTEDALTGAVKASELEWEDGGKIVLDAVSGRKRSS